MPGRSPVQGGEFENLLVEAFRKAGWRVWRQTPAGDMQADLLVEAAEQKYLIDMKEASEGRSDRLIPLLSQAILQAQSLARRLSERAAPLAVVAARRVPLSVAEHLKQFAARHAPEVAVGIIDLEGLRSFVGPGLEKLNAKPSRPAARRIPAPRHLPDLFSDLNQWMLKILLGQRLPETLLSVPRLQIRNASQLAAAAKVSVMSASRFVNQLANQGFLDEDDEQLHIVRVDELLELWLSANRQAAKEYPGRWVLKKGPHQMTSALREYSSPSGTEPNAGRKRRARAVVRDLPRCCAALFSAAEALGVAFVSGAPRHIYLERLTLDSLDRLGLTVGQSHSAGDVYIRIPFSREAVFRAAVIREGIPVTDILQVWLDVSTHPARGREQGEEIRRHVLKWVIEKR